jgi:hypothetical protein
VGDVLSFIVLSMKPQKGHREWKSSHRQAHFEIQSMSRKKPSNLVSGSKTQAALTLRSQLCSLAQVRRALESTGGLSSYSNPPVSPSMEATFFVDLVMRDPSWCVSFSLTTLVIGGMIQSPDNGGIRPPLPSITPSW